MNELLSQMVLFRRTFALWLSMASCLSAGTVGAEPGTLKVAVLEAAPPLGYRDTSGKLTGFAIGVARALCTEIGAQCEFEVTRLESSVDGVATGRFDFAAIGLLITPERSQKVLFTKPVYRSVTLWVGRAGTQPGDPGARISVFRGSAHESYAKLQRWQVIGAMNEAEMIEQLTAGVTQGAIVPLMTSLGMQRNPVFQQLGLNASVLPQPELAGNAAFAINPRRAELKAQLDGALDSIKRKGIYDRINSEFLPFRVE